jgi:hypothetical protein
VHHAADLVDHASMLGKLPLTLLPLLPLCRCVVQLMPQLPEDPLAEYLDLAAHYNHALLHNHTMTTHAPAEEYVHRMILFIYIYIYIYIYVLLS